MSSGDHAPLGTRTYFSAADRQIEHLIHLEDFERSLLINVLYQPHVVVPDIFFFISRNLREHLKNPDSFFCQAAENGVIIPSIRQGSDTLPGMLDQLYGDIPGIESKDEGMVVARLLQKCFDKSGNMERWPDRDLGTRFGERLTETLQARDPSFLFRDSPSDRVARDFWVRTERWRNGSIDKAKQWCGPSLRRGAILSALAEDLGFGDRPYIDDINTQVLDKIADRETRIAASVFFEWVSECYHMSQAFELGAMANFPRASGSSPISDRLFSIPSGSMISPTRLSIKISIPPRWTLHSGAARDLFSIRREYGTDYFKSLGVWQRTPSSANELKLKKAIRSYDSAIHEQFSDKIERYHVPKSINWIVPAAALAVGYSGFHELAMIIESFHLYSIFYMWTKYVPEIEPVELTSIPYASAEVNADFIRSQIF